MNSAHQLPIRLRFTMLRYCGVSDTTLGTSIGIIISINKTFLPGKFFLTKIYATNVLKNAVTAVDMRSIIMVLTMLPRMELKAVE